MIRTIIKAISAYMYPVLGRVTNRCSWSSRTFGGYIIPFWNVRIGKESTISPGALLNAENEGKIVIGSHCYICIQAMLLCYGGRIELGDYVGINPFAILYGHGGLYIGNHVSIAAGTIIIPANHIFSDPTKFIHQQGMEAKGIRIEDNVWIGSHVTVLDGVTIGKGSVIGAGSVVTKDIPPYSVAVGVPCKVIKKRE